MIVSLHITQASGLLPSECIQVNRILYTIYQYIYIYIYTYIILLQSLLSYINKMKNVKFFAFLCNRI